MTGGLDICENLQGERERKNFESASANLKMSIQILGHTRVLELEICRKYLDMDP